MDSNQADKAPIYTSAKTRNRVNGLKSALVLSEGRKFVQDDAVSMLLDLHDKLPTAFVASILNGTPFEDAIMDT